MLSVAFPTLRLCATSVILTWACVTFPVFAQAWSVSGFGTLAYSYENEPDIGYRRHIPQPPEVERDGSFLSDSNLGLQVDWLWDHRWSVTAQWVLEDRIKQDVNHATERAFIRYLPDANWDLRLGRIGLNAYTAADSHRIDYAHLWVRPPQELYGSIFYDSIDGIDITYRTFFRQLNVSTSLQYGAILQTLQVPHSLNHLKTRSNSTLAIALMLDCQEWSARFSYIDVADLVVSLDPESIKAQMGIVQLANSGLGAVSAEAADIYNQSNIHGESVQYWQAGLGYFDGEWQIQSELFYVAGIKQAIPKGHGGYMMLGRSFERLTPYAVISYFEPQRELFTAKSDWSALSPQLGEFQQLLLNGINSTYIDQTTYSLGIRWDVHPQVAIKGQVDFIRTEDMGYGLWAADERSSVQGRDVQLYTLSVNFIF